MTSGIGINPPDEDIISAVDAIQTEAISFLEKIVSIDSTLQVGEGQVQTAIYRHLVSALLNPDDNDSQNATIDAAKRHGLFEVERIPVKLSEIKNQRGFSPVDWNYDGDDKFNVVARYRPRDGSGDNGNNKGNNGRSLILLGHVDVVPANESDGWTSPPFSPTIRDGRMYGRGAGDMKAGVVAMIYALIALKRMGYLPGRQVTLCTVIEEECTGNGALAVPLDCLLPSSSSTETAVIIPEPFPFIATAQLGVLWFRASVTGKPCHVLQTSAGCNAIEGAYQLYSSLKALEERYNEPRGKAHPAYTGMDHPINFNLGRIQGGNWASSVPSSCWFEARVGFFPGITIDSVKKDVEEILHESANKLGLGLEISYRGFHADGAVLLSEYITGAENKVQPKQQQHSRLNSCEKSLQKEFVDTLQKCHKVASSASSSSLSNDNLNKLSSATSDTFITNVADLPLLPLTCTTDARYFSPLFQNPDQVVVTCYGPESTSIHGVDESVSLKSMRDVTVTLALFIRDWCGLVKKKDI